MAVVDVLRPLITREDGGGTAVPSGTLDEVTADDSDLTYIAFPVASSGDNWNLRVEPHVPPANHQRHRARARIRVRCDAGTVSEDIDFGRGEEDYLGFATVPVTDTFAEQATPWFSDEEYGLALAGPLADLNIGGGWAADPDGAAEVQTAECYIDIDCRAQPDYSPEIRDAAGVNQNGGTVTDTNQPTMYFGGVAYDGLPALSWFANIRAGGIDGPNVFDVGGSGTPPTSVPVTEGLDDGAYTAVFGVRSTIRGADQFEHVQSFAFTVSNIVPPPSPPILSVEPEFGGYRLNWNNPGGQPWDDNYVVAEVFRDDCTGSQRIATVPDGLNGTYLDLAIPQTDPQSRQVDGVCEVHSDACDITYRVRYWGYVSTFVELPDTLPADLILAWPDTAASIPSGWTRVTALDGFYPRGAAGTGAPVATGGAANHTHTLPQHAHTIGAHSHSLGGSTATSNASTTSARFNGASQPQANQPHSHARPLNTGTRAAVSSGPTAPGTSTVDNLPPTREVIWIESDGSQASYPTGVLGWATESVSGWEDDAASAGRFLRGAPAAGNGGASSGAATHTHTVNAHTHTGVTHNHTLANTGLSSPVGTNAGFGSSTPRWLPRHTHPMTVSNASTGNLNSASGGTTSAASLEPPNRRLRVLRNVGGGTQTRIIGLYLGDVASLDPLLTLCNGTNGTPDMRTWFCRDRGSDSVNSTGGSTTHTHSAPSHGHTIQAHSHDTNVGVSNTGSFEAPSFGDLGDSPTTGHTHTSGNTAGATPSISSVGSGTTNAVSHVPPYAEAHFVRLDGTISGGPLPVPELKVSDFASITVPAFVNTDGLDRLATLTRQMAVVTDRTHDYPRLVVDSVPLDGGLHTVATTLAGEDMTLAIGVQGLPTINALEELLSADRVYYSPVGGTPGWYAPAGWSVRAPAPEVKLLQVTMVRQPWPTTPDPAEFL
jgi:hypothetical protein